jgi:predicted RNA-binding protein with PIN domain
LERHPGGGRFRRPRVVSFKEAEPGEIQIFYSRAGQTADSIIERLASKYAKRFSLVVATGDYLEQETASASGAETVVAGGIARSARGSASATLAATSSLPR